MKNLSCGCADAETGCADTCPKGILLSPSKVYLIPAWRKITNAEMHTVARNKQLNELKEELK